MDAFTKLIVFSIFLIIAAYSYFGNFDSHIQYLSHWPLGQSIAVYVYKLSSYIHAGTDQNINVKKRYKKSTVFTAEMLKTYDGSEGSNGLYLAILGKIYNVKKGKSHYGPGGGYSFFAGKDGSRGFVSGDFTEEGLTDNVTGLSSQDYIGLNEWMSFYEKDYKFVGKLIGRFYDKNGDPTEYNLQVQKWIEEALSKKDEEDKEKQMFPPCNSEWSKDENSRLWCTTKSGGVERNWVGVPRRLYAPGRRSARCACVKNTGPPSYDPDTEWHTNNGDLDYPKLEEYSGCDPTHSSCQVNLS